MARTKRKVNPVQPVPVPEIPKQRVYQTGGYVRLSVEADPVQTPSKPSRYSYRILLKRSRICSFAAFTVTTAAQVRISTVRHLKR